MKIVVINSGSSSLKSQYFVDQQSIASIVMESIGSKNSTITVTIDNKKIEQKGIEQKKIKIETPLPTHHEALKILFELYSKYKIFLSIDELDGIGHRVVHGGSKFNKPALITTDVIETIRSLIPLAPLHNPANLDGIEIIKSLYPDTPQVAIFDTAFHQSIPKEAYIYPIPYNYYKDLDIRRYGFHGTSHQFVAKRASSIIGKSLSHLNLITLHLGNGASVTAIKDGKSIDTSMGFTPLEGLMMGSRSGDIDPAIIPYIVRNHHLSVDEVDTMLNKKSGLLGICGTNDMREIIKRAKDGEDIYRTALDIYIHRIRKYIGAYTILLGRVDAIIFTGGIGENSSYIRELVSRDMEQSIGLHIDIEKNRTAEGDTSSLHSRDSKIDIYLIKTDEELEITRECEYILSNL
ncbi:Acetate kinase [hydrothermal vent metagenome]|uniref:Acetate kinase n=1 Tax=hydrothermal vent metagenome TaxID=652676 RepID=A0A1W1BK52_9ZZZZ